MKKVACLYFHHLVHRLFTSLAQQLLNLLLQPGSVRQSWDRPGNQANRQPGGCLQDTGFGGSVWLRHVDVRQWSKC
jgi:hypothetical protein